MPIDGIGRYSSAAPVARPAPAEGPERAVPPRGDDLRAVLTADEAAYFAELEQLGRVTYGPGARAEAPGPRLGQRVDVRA